MPSSEDSSMAVIRESEALYHQFCLEMEAHSSNVDVQSEHLASLADMKVVLPFLASYLSDAS